MKFTWCWFAWGIRNHWWKTWWIARPGIDRKWHEQIEIKIRLALCPYSESEKKGKKKRGEQRNSLLPCFTIFSSLDLKQSINIYVPSFRNKGTKKTPRYCLRIRSLNMGFLSVRFTILVLTSPHNVRASPTRVVFTQFVLRNKFSSDILCSTTTRMAMSNRKLTSDIYESCNCLRLVRTTIIFLRRKNSRGPWNWTMPKIRKKTFR